MNAILNPYRQYKKHDILMASPLELIVMLYSGCIKQLKLADVAINGKDFETANLNLHKAQEIISELINGLDFSYSISNELMSLYEFINRQISLINIKKDAGAIEPIVEILAALRDSWVKVQKQQKHDAYREYESES